MLVVVAILGVLATVSAGGFDSSPRDSDLRNEAASGLRSVLTAARFTALAKGLPVRVTINGDAAPNAVSNSFAATHLGGTWDGSAGVQRVVGAEKFFPKVKIVQATTPAGVCTVPGAGVGLGSTTVEFRANGRAVKLPGGNVTISFAIKSLNAGVKKVSCLQIRPLTGRIAIIEQ